jgi:hypothetical protein
LHDLISEIQEQTGEAYHEVYKCAEAPARAAAAGEMTPDHDRLLTIARAAYGDMLPALHPHRNHCRETAALIAGIARGMGFKHIRRCSGRRLTDGGADHGHFWTEVDGVTLHSPGRERIEIANAEVLAELTEEWAAGPPPSRIFRVGPRP